MLGLIRKGWWKVVRFFTGRTTSVTGVPEAGSSRVTGEISPPRIPAGQSSTSSESPLELQEKPIDLSRWNVTNSTESPFEKCGRLYIEGDDLVIRSDLDTQGFCIPLIDVVAVLDGETVPVLLLSNRTQVGVAKRSVSGKAMNIWIDPFLYTSPLMRVMDVLEGRARKAAVFVGREVG